VSAQSPVSATPEPLSVEAREEQARAYSAAATMIGWSLEVACRLSRPIDGELHRLLSEAWARALQVMTEQRAAWQALRKQRRG